MMVDIEQYSYYRKRQNKSSTMPTWMRADFGNICDVPLLSTGDGCFILPEGEGLLQQLEPKLKQQDLPSHTREVGLWNFQHCI